MSICENISNTFVRRSRSLTHLGYQCIRLSAAVYDKVQEIAIKEIQNAPYTLYRRIPTEENDIYFKGITHPYKCFVQGLLYFQLANTILLNRAFRRKEEKTLTDRIFIQGVNTLAIVSIIGYLMTTPIGLYISEMPLDRYASEFYTQVKDQISLLIENILP